ncbi:mtnA [Symbiodinium sp. CCMP2456]|nr:mtnA [Symbiodinium sp. CCMP2456]
MKVIRGFLLALASQSTGTLAVEPGNSVRSPYADVPLTSWPMLTTHDAATGYMQNPLDPRVTWGQTQPASKHAFTQQLNCGARAFDMRLHVTDEGKVVFHHGDVEIMQDAETALAEIVQWAQQHPALEDFVLIYNWDCTGVNCSTKVAELLAKYGLATLANCSQLNLTLSAAASMASLPHGGHVLVVNDCVQQHYNESLACSGFDHSFDASDMADLARDLPHCLELHKASVDELLLCGHQLQQRHAATAPTSAVGYYQCWVGASGHDFAVQRLLGYLTGVASKPLPADSFTELQALWQETPQSVAIGVAHFSSLLKDEEQSQLNALMVQKIRSGAFGHISLFEVNNVCDHGLEMVAALRFHLERSLTTGWAGCKDLAARAGPMRVDGTWYRTIWLKDPDVVQIIDQRHLPHQFVIEDVRSLDEMSIVIKDMHVRGAGLIGCAAAYGMYLSLRELSKTSSAKEVRERLEHASQQLRATRPTAVNLRVGVEKVAKAVESVLEPNGGRLEAALGAARKEAARITDEDADFCRRIGEAGADLLQQLYERKKASASTPEDKLTINARLCIVSSVYAAFDKGLPIHVWVVDETRPRNQGASLTAWELAKHGVAHTVIADNAGGHLMRTGLVDVVITGADRVSSCGDACNKIGTYLKALAAKDNNLPFYVALPSSTIDWRLKDGADIPIEQRGDEEVKYAEGLCEDGKRRKVLLTPANSSAGNWAFDVTPSRLVTGLLTERGLSEASEKGLAALFSEAHMAFRGNSSDAFCVIPIRLIGPDVPQSCLKRTRHLALQMTAPESSFQA